MENPTFSIIIPTYNRPDQLAVCLTALAHLTYPRDHFEVVVVDDGGETPLDPVVAPYCGVLHLTMLRQENAGPAAARNCGASRATGAYLAFTDDDCLPAAEWLTAFARRFSVTPNRLIGGRTINALAGNRYASASQMIVDLVYRHYNPDPDRARFFASNNMALPATLFREVGGFRPDFRTSEDRELCDRWRFNGHEMTYAPEAVLYHAHDLTLRGYCRQHFGYGRGAYRFHALRNARKSGRLLDETRFHLNARNWLLYPFSHVKGWNAVSLVALMILWQVINIAGFMWEAVFGERP